MQTLSELYKDISKDNNRWSYYQNTSFDINEIWNNKKAAMDFIEFYFNYAGKGQSFDKYLSENRDFIEIRTPHIISTFLIGIKLFECFGINIETRDMNNINIKYYWFLTCLYHDIGYAYEDNSKEEQLKLLQKDGLEAIREICDIKYLDNSEFITYSREIVDIYLMGRSICHDGKPGVIDHGITGGILLYDRLRKQFDMAWEKRTDKNDSKQCFYIKDECHDKTLHLSNKHYLAYAKAADAIMAHNIWRSTLYEYIEKYGTQKRIVKCFNKISFENQLCFILSIADTIEPMKRDADLINTIRIGSIPSVSGIKLFVSKAVYNKIYKECIPSLRKWIDAKVNIDLGSENVIIEILREQRSNIA